MGSTTSASLPADSTSLDPTLGKSRWLLPSVGDLLFVAFLVLLTCTTLAVRLLGDAGIGWHIRTGQLILRTHSIPRFDPFSSSLIGRPWFAWEWLYDIAVGWLNNVAGLNGIVLFTALIIAAVFSWTFRLLLRRGTSLFLALILMLLAASASMIHFFARPHVVSWLFTVAWFWVLQSSEPDRPAGDKNSLDGSASSARRLWLLPLLMLVWVNVHGGFIFGFALLAIYSTAAAWDWLRLARNLTGENFENVLLKTRAGRRFRDLVVTTLLSAAATFVNPYGWRLHLHIYAYLTNRFLMDHIEEFQSPNFHLVAQKCFALLLLLTLIAVAAKSREIKLSDLLLLLLSVFSGLWAARNIPVFSLLLILLIGPWLSHALEKIAQARVGPTASRRSSGAFSQRMGQIDLKLKGHLWPVAAVILASLVAAHGGTLGSKQFMHANFDPQRFPDGAVNYIESRYPSGPIPGPILAPDYWGGYFIYRLHPRIKVVVDDRHDFYGQKFLEKYLQMLHAAPNWRDFLLAHPARFVILPKDSALSNLLLETKSWQLIYHDDVARVFVPTSPKPD